MTTVFTTAPLVPVELQLPTATKVTLYQPGWSSARQGASAFLGSDGKVYAFDTVTDLASYVDSGARHDLTESPHLRQVRMWTVETYVEQLCPYDLSVPTEFAADALDDDGQAALGSSLALLLDLLDHVRADDTHADALRNDDDVERLAGGETVPELQTNEQRRRALAQLLERHWPACVAAVAAAVTTPEVPAESAASVSGGVAAGADHADDGPPVLEQLTSAVTLWFAFADRGAYTIRTTTAADGHPAYLGQSGGGPSPRRLLGAEEPEDLLDHVRHGRVGDLPGVDLAAAAATPDLSLVPGDDFIFDLVEIGETIGPEMSVDAADRLVSAWTELLRLAHWGRWQEVIGLLDTASPIGRFVTACAIDLAQDRAGAEEALASMSLDVVRTDWAELVETAYRHVTFLAAEG